MKKNHENPTGLTRFMEWVWLFVAFLSLSAGIHAVTHHETKQGLVFFLMMLLSLAMFFLRRQLRIHKKNKDS